MPKVFVDVPELLQWRGERALVLFDCRHQLAQPEAGRKAYRAGHIPGAYFADVDRELAAIHEDVRQGGRHPLPEKAAFEAQVRRWGIGRQHTVVVYDDMGGAFAARLWWMLMWLGHPEVYVLNGGIQAWQAAGQALSSEAPEALPSSDFVAGKARLSVLPLEAVIDNLEQGAWQLLDARDRPRFLGEIEPFGPVAGHIPGAWSLPFKGALDTDGKLLPEDQLKARFAPLMGREDLLSYCGSGVTGAFNIAAMLHVGVPAPRLYIGSWSEWSARTELPVATGPEVSQPMAW